MKKFLQSKTCTVAATPSKWDVSITYYRGCRQSYTHAQSCARWVALTLTAKPPAHNYGSAIIGNTSSAMNRN
ncbi:hypothetical protein TRIP_B180008 [uncultured Desulfatiglans sp.]|uniref:Uncharacterized protein n=1 Tax=Uncultured Desulfatiglans sp. TaxID=1748965 RepID=A0A653A1A2_UNCDX|nr:hypothetical protein TRIP_B180008 [uncultured Desulfatiglans sp.]